MESVANQISDSTILNLIRENNLKGWNLLYDKYTSMMYGIIYTHKDDKGLADEILINLFIRLKEEQMLLRINFALCVCIPYHTYSNAEQELKRRGINCTESPFMGNSILHIFNSQYWRQTTIFFFAPNHPFRLRFAQKQSLHISLGKYMNG